MMLFDDESTDDFNNMMQLYLVAGNRYFKARTSIPNPLEFCNGMDYSDTSFRTKQDAREGFLPTDEVDSRPYDISNELKKINKSPVHIQLIIVLNRLGCDGSL
jgi:hypothetical protein